jgi:NitT/TauT family transport system permease protein
MIEAKVASSERVSRRGRPKGFIQSMGAIVVPPLLGAVVLVGIWYGLDEIVSTFFLPRPDSVLRALITNRSLLLHQGSATIQETVAGLLLSIVIGFGIAFLISEIPFMTRVFLPWLIISQAIPKVAIAPLFVLWLGFGVIPTAVIAFFISVFPVVISTVGGFASVLPEEMDLFRTMTRKRWPVYRHLKIPRAMPQFFDGVRVATSLALIGAVVGEFVSAASGLGFLVIVANRNLQTSLMFAVFIVLSLIGIVLFYAIVLVERIVIPWHKQLSKHAR